MHEDVIAKHVHHLRLRGLSPVTIYHRQRALCRLADTLDTLDLLSLTTTDLQGWRAGLTVASATIADYVSHVREFYGWAVDRDLIGSSPAADLPVPRTVRRLPRPISEADLMYAVDAAPRRIRPWLVLAAWCGLRAKEIACLRGENVLLHATPPMLLIASDATKGIRERTVPLCQFAVAEMCTAMLPVRGLAFRRFDGAPVVPGLVSKLANQHLHDCGIPATLHQLRHRFGTMTYHVSHDLRAVQELLGHASPNTTAGYAAYDRAEALAAVQALPVPQPTLPMTG